MSNRIFKGSLLTTTVIAGIAMANPAYAQDATNTPGAQSSAPAPEAQDESQNQAPVANTNEGNTQEDIVVTGTLFRSTTSKTTSPITVVTAESMEKRGNNTVQDAIQQLASNNGPALTNSFTANGAFAAGASAVSLRGLSTNSTLVLFDGQRAAYYPLADDGSRNFVDLNTIPDDIVDRVEVLRDGASSTYGADAIAGVVNIITKRQFTGVQARAEAGVSQDGNGATRRLSLTAGIGDLADKGFNAYLSGFYYKQDIVYNRDLPYPFNTDNETQICHEGECGPNNIVNSRDPITGELSAFLVGYDTYVRPYNATNTAPIPGQRFQLLNPAAGCRFGEGYALSGSEAAALPTAPNQVCTVDLTGNFGVVQPNIERFGGSMRATARLADNHEGYFMFNFQQSKVDYTGFPPVIRGQANAGILFRPFSTSAGPAANLAPGSFALSLPVFVCPQGVGDAQGVNTGCTATTPGAVLNPNNPFAAQGQTARIIGRPFSDPTYNETRSRVYRAALGLTGSIFGGWDYRVDATAMHNDLRRTQENYVYIANLLTAIAQGTINLRDETANTQAQRDFISPRNINDATSDLYALQASLGRSLFDLPGGPVQLGFGAQIRYEAVDAPSGNPDYNGPTQRFFTLNAFGTSGSRVVKSAFAEIQAPVFDMLELNASGRFDHYSSGQKAFSPKVAAKFEPFDQLAIRASWSKGFRIPSFGEANALPTTGFVSTNAANFTDSFLAQYGCSVATYSTCPAYVRVNSYGQTTLASPDLDPEKSRSFTLGAIFNPIRNFTFTVDYYDIKKTGAITQPSNSPALTAYYNGAPIPAGYNVIAGAPDINNPNATPVVGFIEAQLINSNTIRARGLDFAASARFDLGSARFTSSLEASRILELSTSFPDGTREDYEGTLGNYNLTAGSGTPKWHGSWQNTVDLGKFSLTGTANYFGGYNLSAEDQGGEAGDCSLGVPFTPCNVGKYITLDMVAQFRPTERFTFYLTMLNALDNYPDVDAATYGAHLYNPVQAGQGILGRQFRGGVKVNF